MSSASRSSKNYSLWMTEKLPPFPEKIRKKVKKEQEHRCAACGQEGHLSCHHIVPRSLAPIIGLTAEEAQCRHNAVGLCQECHEHADRMALEHGQFFYEMEPGKEYPIPPKIRKKVERYRKRLRNGA